MGINFPINKKYHCDIDVLYKYRPVSDGIDFMESHIIFDKYEADHKPSFSIWFSIFNICILDFEIYNIHHSKEKNNG